MSLLGDIGKIAGGIAGNAILPGIGGVVGSALGGEVGKMLQKPTMDVFNAFAKNPLGALANPNSLPSVFVDGVLQQMGMPKEFRSLVKFATDPQSAIQNVLQQGFPNPIRCVSGHGAVAPTPPGQHNLSTNGTDTIDTGRYLISAKENEVKIYDKETNTWVKAHGDPHLLTSDGDKGQFTKNNLTIDLEDGTKITIKPTAEQNGVAWIDKVAVTKGSEAVVMSGFHDGAAGVQMGNILNNADAVDRQFADGTVLRAGRQVDDLTFAAGGKELVGGDPTQRWGEHNLDGKGGVSRWNPRWDLPQVRPMPFPIAFPLPFNPGLDLGKLQDVMKNFDPSKVSDALSGGLQGLIDAATNLLKGLTGPTGAEGAKGTEAAKGGAPGVADMVRDESIRGEGANKAENETAALGKGGDIYSRLFAVLAKLQKSMEKKLGQIEDHSKKMDAKGKEGMTMEDKVALDKLQFELQQIQNTMQQITTTATNLLKNEHDTRMSVVRNLA